MKTHSVEIVPAFYARIAGAFYLVIIAGGLFAEMFVLQRLIVYGDAAVTASNIADNEFLFRLGFVVHVVILFSALGVLFILYQLFKNVSKDLALLMVFFNIVSIAIEAVTLLGHFAPLVLLSGSNHLDALTQEQLHALVYVPLRMQSAGYDIALAFFGFFCFFTGLLIIKSAFIPKMIGVLMVIAGVCYWINSFTNFIAPQYSLFPFIVLPCLIGELSLCLFLLFNGINTDKWKKLYT